MIANQHSQRLAARNAVFERIGVRHAERWRTEAEDQADMSVPKLRKLGELLHWVTVHAKGERRSSLLASMDLPINCDLPLSR